MSDQDSDFPDSAFRGRAVPSGRISRLARFGGMASGIAGGMALDGLRRLASGERPRLESLLLTPANARRMADQLAQMRGAAMKVGQLLSMETGDLFPPEFTEILSRLRADAEPMPPRQLKQVLIAGWGAGFLKRFERFDVRPIAAASIGQVHRALTRDGRDLAIKVQYPGVRDSIDSDVANVASLIRMSGLAPPGLELGPQLDEAKRQLHEEADYEQEAGRLAQFHALLAETPAVAVPAPQPDLTTRDLLAMSFIESAPIEVLVPAPQAERDRIMDLLIVLLLRELFEFRLMQSDPNFANYRYCEADGRLALLDFGATREISEGLSATYRRLLAAGVSGDRDALRSSAIEMGYFDETAQEKHQVAIVAMIEMGLEPLRFDGVYDFARSDLIERMRDAGMAFALERDIAHVPPIDVLYLQRKIAGLFLLGARLGARVRVRDRLEPYLAAS